MTLKRQLGGSSTSASDGTTEYLCILLQKYTEKRGRDALRDEPGAAGGELDGEQRARARAAAELLALLNG